LCCEPFDNPYLNTKKKHKKAQQSQTEKMKKESSFERLELEAVKVFGKKNTTRMGGDYFCKTRRA
jgi:hypothetical protein